MRTDPGRFYGPASGLPIGAGIVLRDCPYPLPDESKAEYRTAVGPTLVLTHECDVDQNNDRMFTDHILVVPIVPLEILCQQLEDDFGKGSWGGLLPKIAADEVFRVSYLPPIPAHLGATELSFGGVINLNNISYSPLEWFHTFNTMPVCSLSYSGLRSLDVKLENHLRRAKSVYLPFSR